MKKKEKFTQVYFNEADPVMEIDLKHRLTAFARQYPDLCRIVSDGGEGRMSFEIDKRRCAFRLTAPYSEERKQRLRETAQAQGIHTREAHHG